MNLYGPLFDYYYKYKKTIPFRDKDYYTLGIKYVDYNSLYHAPEQHSYLYHAYKWTKVCVFLGIPVENVDILHEPNMFDDENSIGKAFVRVETKREKIKRYLTNPLLIRSFVCRKIFGVDRPYDFAIYYTKRWKLRLNVKQEDYLFAWSKNKWLSYNNYKECISYMIANIGEKVMYAYNTNILYARGSETTPYPIQSAGFEINSRVDIKQAILRPVTFYNEMSEELQKCILYRNRDDWGEGSREFVEKYCPNIQPMQVGLLGIIMVRLINGGTCRKEKL